MDAAAFPNVTATNLTVTSPATWAYNCIAWSLGDTSIWWSPAPGGYYWPRGLPKNMASVPYLISLYRQQGFEVCADASLEAGFEKVVLYANGGIFQHVALQLSDGRWTSKLGGDEDVEHDSPDVLANGDYGTVVCVLKRPRPTP
jgi:hypothetical protein